ncbi:uncharacterized protein LOC135492844 [Lineus longissimus]|uniref:uncharacterized protein LOC135492844 n=1 Tax=Lineus longissimus TaxID=88925 RepID=UPI002B4CD585
MILNTSLLVLLGVSSMVSGLKLCDDPMPAPEIIKLSATPTLNAMNRLVELETTVQLKSSVPVQCRWASFGEMHHGGRFASQDSQDFISTVEESGDLYTFKVLDKLSGNDNNITKVLAELMIYLDVGGRENCNVYTIVMWWSRMKKMHQAGIQFPTVLQMPRTHYIVDDNAPNELMTVLSPITENPSEFDYAAFCYETYVRTNGKLEFTQRNGYERKGNVFESVVQARQDENIGRGCTVTLSDSVESLLMPFSLRVKRGSYGEPDYFDFRLYFDVEFRRPNVQGVALTVTGGDRVISRKGVIVVTASKNMTQLKCMADATKTPAVTAQSINYTIGTFRLLKPHPDKLQINEFHRYALFRFESPKETNEEADYECIARGGNEAIIQEIKVIRYGAVKLKEEQMVVTNSLYADSDTMTLSCETTSGDPKPAIRFYGSPPKISWTMPEDYFENNKGYEIVNSKFFKVVYTTAENGQAKGTLTIKNMDQATPADLKGYDARWGSYRIVCVAYNTYAMDDEILAFWYL